MNNSHEVITLETMAQCLADARALLHSGDMCADTYVSLLEEAARLIRSVLAFAQDVGLEIDDGDETEAWAIVDRYYSVLAHKRSKCFQGGDFDLYLDLQDSWDTLVVESRSGDGDDAVESVFPSLYRLRWFDAEVLPGRELQNHCKHTRDDPTEAAFWQLWLDSWVTDKDAT